MSKNSLFHYLALVLLALLLGGCVVVPKELDHWSANKDADFARRVFIDGSTSDIDGNLLLFDAFEQNKRVLRGANVLDGSLLTEAGLISPGDMLRIAIEGLEESEGLYQVTRDGILELPYLADFKVRGMTRAQAEAAIKETLIEGKWFHRDKLFVHVSIVHMAPILVSVTGSVFAPGRVGVNIPPIDKPKDLIQQHSGFSTNGRDIIAVLRAAGGIRPDADLTQIYLKRHNKIYRLDLTQLITGKGLVRTPSLLPDDEVYVMSVGYENSHLVRGSQITPGSMKVLMSNLIAPAYSNSQAAIKNFDNNTDYGSTLIDVLVAANCVGGTESANARRSAVLITKDHGSKERVVISRAINSLLANSSDSSINPFVMPNDAVACYDSRYTNFRDVARGIGDLLSPVAIGRRL